LKVSIEHIAIFTQNLERLKSFYQKYFDAESNEKYQNKSGFSSYFLTFSSGTRMEIMSHKNLADRETTEKIVGMHHIAFSVGSRDNVIELTNKITNDGYALLSAPRNTGDGYFESCIADPDGNVIEITV
jgi:lactoylglutathione lyase